MWQRQYEGGTWRILSYRILRKTLKRVPKKENGGISQADQRENHRFFRSLSR